MKTRLVWLQRNEEGLLSDQTTKAMGNEENGPLGLVRSAVGNGICKGFSMPTDAFSACILPEAYNVGVVAVGDDSRGRKAGTHKVWCEGPTGVPPSRLAVSGQAMHEPDAGRAIG